MNIYIKFFYFTKKSNIYVKTLKFVIYHTINEKLPSNHNEENLQITVCL